MFSNGKYYLIVKSFSFTYLNFCSPKGSFVMSIATDAKKVETPVKGTPKFVPPTDILSRRIIICGCDYLISNFDNVFLIKSLTFEIYTINFCFLNF